jgi:hypothetical protein
MTGREDAILWFALLALGAYYFLGSGAAVALVAIAVVWGVLIRPVFVRCCLILRDWWAGRRT